MQKYIIAKIAYGSWIIVDMSDLDANGYGKQITINGVRDFSRRKYAQTALNEFKQER